jgi:tRNA U34 2-thiouridine synthase MnmA/TrmU
VGPRTHLRIAELTLEETSFVESSPAPGTEVLVQHRAHGDVALGELHGLGSESMRVVFERPVEAVAPGQSVALYSAQEPDALVGGGIIAATQPASLASDAV